MADLSSRRIVLLSFLVDLLDVATNLVVMLLTGSAVIFAEMAQGIADSLATLLEMLEKQPRAQELRTIAEQHYDWSAKAKLLAEFAQRIVTPAASS